MSDPTIAAPEAKLTRIQALLDRATHKDTPPEEAELAMARAMDMMSKYGVTEMMLGARRAAATDRIVDVRIDLSGRYTPEKCYLLCRIASALGCRSVYWGDARYVGRVDLIGYSSDTRRVQMLYTSLLLQMLNQVQHVHPMTYWGSGAATTAYRRSWMRGFADEVGWRLKEAELRARRAYDDEHGGDRTALVVRDRKIAVNARYDELHGDVKAEKRRERDARAEQEGRSAGLRADIGMTEQVGGDRIQLGH